MEMTQMRFKKNKDKNAIPSIKADIENNEKTASIEEFNNSVDSSFFYTSYKQLNALDDSEIIKYIIQTYPNFVQSSKDALLKKTFLAILDDEQFINSILNHYDLTIYDFFKIVYKNYSSLFNTLFIKKIKDKIKNKKYARK